MGTPPLFKSAEEIEEKVELYKQHLQETERMPTMAGLAYWLGCDRRTLWNYSNKDDFFPTIKKYRDWIECELEQQLVQKGHGGVVFLAKNYGYTDKQDRKSGV
jgi:hypothetical protein